MHEETEGCNRLHKEKLRDTFFQQIVFGWSNHRIRNERETQHELRRQKCIENSCLKNWNRNKTCNKLGHVKGKFSSGSKRTREGYAAFIRSRKEHKSRCSKTVTNIWFHEVQRLFYISKNLLASLKKFFLGMSYFSSEGTLVSFHSSSIHNRYIRSWYKIKVSMPACGPWPVSLVENHGRSDDKILN